jgi:hypothetical protein
MKTKHKKIFTPACAVKSKELDPVSASPEYKHEVGKALARLTVKYVLAHEYKKLVLYI